MSFSKHRGFLNVSLTDREISGRGYHMLLLFKLCAIDGGDRRVVSVPEDARNIYIEKVGEK